MQVWQTSGDRSDVFLNLLLGDGEVTAALTETGVRELFDMTYHTKHIDTIFDRVFGINPG